MEIEFALHARQNVELDEIRDLAKKLGFGNDAILYDMIDGLDEFWSTPDEDDPSKTKVEVIDAKVERGEKVHFDWPIPPNRGLLAAGHKIIFISMLYKVQRLIKEMEREAKYHMDYRGPIMSVDIE